ncbi:uncharacterized protein DS421_19g654590 [Arachis hypogaea]|uniref:Uncharacterized protein n=1 Tax=Arachis hypogaea TaxID=3818 RepID=A0A6B9VA38_ARAHY|nr:uncharacterized protein DS421_19g654590 [Arachis hypogaea]
MEPKLASPSLSFGAGLEESGVVTVAGERESKRRSTRLVRRVAHRGGTVPLPLLSPEFLVAIIINVDLSQLEPLAKVLPLPEANVGVVAGSDSIILAVSALDHIRFKILVMLQPLSSPREINAIAVPVDAAATILGCIRIVTAEIRNEMGDVLFKLCDYDIEVGGSF